MIDWLTWLIYWLTRLIDWIDWLNWDADSTEDPGRASKKKKKESGTKTGTRISIIRFRSNSCKMPVQVPAIHGSWWRSLWFPRVLTKSPSSLSMAVSTFFAMVADTSHKSVRLHNEYQAQIPDLALGYLYEDVGQICLWRRQVCSSAQLLSPIASQQRCTWLEPTHQSRINSDEYEWMRTHATVQPSPNEDHHFFHHIWKFSHSTMQLIWYRDFLQPVKLASKHLNAHCKVFHRFMQFLFSLHMLSKQSAILLMLKTEKESTLYTTSIQENMACVTGFSYFKSDSIQE